MYSVDPNRSCAQTLNAPSSCPGSQTFQLLASGHMSHSSCGFTSAAIRKPFTHSPVLPHSASSLHTHTHTHYRCLSSWPWMHSPSMSQSWILILSRCLTRDIDTPLDTQKQTCTYKQVMVVPQTLWSFQQRSGAPQLSKCQLVLWSHSERHTPHPGSQAMSPTYQLMQLDLHKHSDSLAHSHSIQLLHHRHTGSNPGPIPGLTLRYTHTQLHTKQGVPHPRNELGMEFRQKTGQAALIKYRAWPEKNTDQRGLQVTHPFYPFIPLFCHTYFSSKPPSSFPFPILVSTLNIPQ